VERLDNLNLARIVVDCGEHRPLADPGFVRGDGTRVHFRNVVNALVRFIGEADFVIGCVAWLTHPDVLTALAAKKGVSIVVQKEDWLRPDSDSGWSRSRVRKQYTMLRGMDRYDAGFRRTDVAGLSTASDSAIQAVRCVGNYNADRAPASPRMHHKFVLACRRRAVSENVFGATPWNPFSVLDADGRPLVEDLPRFHDSFEPYAVWTGSFNFTVNGGHSLENAIELRDADVVGAYFHEYTQALAISESLDWEYEWVAPEWRDGT